MEERIKEYLVGLSQLDNNSYSYLISNYEEKLVNKVLDELINEDSSNIIKFDYYIKNICNYDEDVVFNGIVAYLKDISSYKIFNNDDNLKLLKEIIYIKEEINGILNDDSNDLLCDRIENIINYSNKRIDKDKLMKLYKEFCNKRNELMMGNLKFVIYISKKYLNLYNDLNVLIQYGNIGLMQAIEKYDFKYNTSFTTYAYYWVKRSILINASFDKTSFKIPYNVVNLNINIKKAERELSKRLNRCPTLGEIAAYLNVSVNKVRDVCSIYYNGISLQDFVVDDDVMVMDCIRDDIDLENDIMNKFLVIDFRKFLRSNLSNIEYDIICHRYNIDGKNYLVFKQLSNKFGYSVEGIRKIEQRALKKIRENGKELVVYLER